MTKTDNYITTITNSRLIYRCAEDSISVGGGGLGGDGLHCVHEIIGISLVILAGDIDMARLHLWKMEAKNSQHNC